jgi:ABC-type glycerol-3-phosphate transport system substrate-binding protein
MSAAAALTAGGVLLSAGGATASTNKVRSNAVKPASNITVWGAVGDDYDWQQPLLKGFTAATGIKVNFQAYPETTMLDKIQAAQEVKSNAYAVFEEPQSQTSDYISLKGVAPIGQYLNNTKLTPASYNRAGVPTGETAQCTVNGKIYCVPLFTDPGPQMFYNKAMFKAAGLTPPKSWAQVQSDAAKLTTSTVSGICLRGSETAPNGYPVLLMLPYFLPYAANYKGEYLNAKWKPLFDTPQALTWANEYATLMQKYAPKGVSAYDYTDCQHAFQTGTTAMWWDDSSLANTLYQQSQDPQEYKNAGIDEIPCPSFNPTCLLSAPWGMYVNPNTTPAQQLAGYEFLEYMTSPKVQIYALNTKKNTAVATRPATLAYAIKNAAKFNTPTDYLQAVQYSTQHIEPNAIPVTAAFTVIQNTLFITLSQLITSQVSPSQADSQLQSQMTQQLQKFGLGG